MSQFAMSCTCGAVVEPTPQNAAVFDFWRQPIYNHLAITCACGIRGRLWRLSYSDMALLVLVGIDREKREWAPEAVITAHTQFEIRMLWQPKNLDEGQERVLASFIADLDQAFPEPGR